MNMNEKQTILIVDDSKFNRDILKEILGETYHYLEAENGNQAIQLVGDNLGIDLILLDIHMPQMDGFEVLEMMNKSQCINETPVIMISSEESVTMMRKAYEMGITDYITRPFDTVIVKKRVQNTLDLYVNQKRLINVVVDQFSQHQFCCCPDMQDMFAALTVTGSQYITQNPDSHRIDAEKTDKNIGYLSVDRVRHFFDHNGIFSS